MLHTLSSEALVAEELGAHTLGGHLSTTLGLLNAVPVGLSRLVMVGMVLGLGHTRNKLKVEKYEINLL